MDHQNISVTLVAEMFSFSGDSNDIVHVRRFALAEPHGHIKRTRDSEAVESPMDHQNRFEAKASERFFL